MKNFGIFGILAMTVLGGCATEVGEATSADQAAAMADAVEETARAETLATDYDPFAGEMPDLLVHAHVHVLSQDWLELTTIRQLATYGEHSGDDPRPWLLLGLDSINRGEPGIATRYYRLACEADPDVAAFTEMRDDLIWTAIEYEGVERREAIALLDEMWGEQVLPAIDDLMMTFHEEGDLEHARALYEVRNALIGE